MKRQKGKSKSAVKGMPSAVLLSILIHIGLFMLAGALVVFTVVKKEEKVFEPPRAVERPKMKLKKPKVKLKKSSKPKSTTRIVTKAKTASMPDMQLPEMGGMGNGLGDGIGDGFDLLLDPGELTVFGAGQSIGNDLEGTFYDFKRDSQGRDIPFQISKFLQDLKEFVQQDYRSSVLARYYRSPKKLYATTVMVPPVFSILAPQAFGEEDTAGFLWIVHYHGKLVCPASYTEGITFRYWGMGDDIMVVSVDGDVVLNACWPTMWRGWDFKSVAPSWRSSSADSRKYFYGHNKAEVGDWITLMPGESKDLNVIIGETPGGHFVAMLSVEVKGETYEKGPQGNPILPIFKTATPSLDLIETIHGNLVPGEVCVTNGPVFCDYDSSGSSLAETEKEEPVAPLQFSESQIHELRSWTLSDGNEMTARFVVQVGDKVVLKDERERQHKVLVSRLSEEDRLYTELAQPPEFSIDFSKSSKHRVFKESLYITGVRWLPKHLDYDFSTRLKQTSAGDYNHELNVEFFAIGDEIDGDNYILLDRQESSFTPSKENNRSHSFSGNTVGLRQTQIFTQVRGQKYGGYLVVVTDQRGVIIDVATSNDWLRDIIAELRRLPIGKHFNKAGSRVEPPRPKPIGRY